MVYRETFLQIHLRPLQHLIRRSWICGVPEQESRFTHPLWKRVKCNKQDQDLRCQSGPSAKDSVTFSGDSSKSYGADHQRLHISDLHFDKLPTPATFACWKNKIQDWGMYLFTISYGSYAMDQRSGDGWFRGWFNVFVICQRNSNAEFWSTRCEDCFSTEQNRPQFSVQKEESVWRNKRPKSRTFSFAEDRLLTWSMSTSGSQEPTILSRFMPTYSLLLLEMTIIRNSIQSGTDFYCQRQKSHLMTSWKDCTKIRTRESEKLKTVLALYNMEIHQEKIRTWLSQIENNGEKKYRAGYTK